jgi:hypothetical protein
VDYVYEIGLMDVDYETTLTVAYQGESGMKVTKNINVPRLGDNSVQTVPINLANVYQVKLTLTRSGAVTFLSFLDCPTPTPMPTPPPNPCACINSTIITFDKLPNGTTIPGGTYVQNEWFDTYGIKLSASGGLGDMPRIFDTNYIGTREYGDPDLGTPNEKCGGPGIGKGGEPGQPGANCAPLGNVLIIQEDNADPTIPDDQGGGGTITFEFTTHVHYIYEIGVMDIEERNRSFITVIHEVGTRQERTQIDIVGLGDNAVQTVPINIEHASKLTLNLDTSGAITHLAVCMES